MQRLVLALVFVACSSPAGPQPDPAKKTAPEPAVEVKKATPEVKAPDTKVEPPKPEVVKYADQAAALAAMPADVAGLADAAAIAAYVERIKGTPGIGSAEVTKGSSEGFGIKLDPAVDAAELAKQFNWAAPFAVSGDAKQQSFAVHLSKGEVEGSKGKKITTEFPRFGEFRVEARLVERPKGKTPGVKAGASPAYDLAIAKASVLWLFFMRAG
jgi:hypothetical protein